MRTWSRSFLVASVTIVSFGGCRGTQRANDGHVSEHDAGNTRPGVPDAGDAPIQAAATDVGMGFVRIPLEATLDPANPCGASRQSIALAAPPNVLVTTGCSLYSVNTVSHEVVQRMPQADVVDDDGSTVAVIAGQLGLSLDGGETFAWTDWALGRCSGLPRLSAGSGFAVVDCIAGAGRWRGVGTAFETLTLGSGSILPVVAARDSHVIINASDGWYESSDYGDNFQPWRVSGLPDGARPDRIEIVDSKLFAIVPVGAGTDGAHMDFFAAPLGGGAFARVTAFPLVTGRMVSSYNEGTLVAMTGNTIYFSTDTGASFTEMKLEGIVIPLMTSDPAVKYGSGHLYILTSEALYVGPLPTHG